MEYHEGNIFQRIHFSNWKYWLQVEINFSGYRAPWKGIQPQIEASFYQQKTYLVMFIIKILKKIQILQTEIPY